MNDEYLYVKLIEDKYKEVLVLCAPAFLTQEYRDSLGLIYDEISKRYYNDLEHISKLGKAELISVSPYLQYELQTGVNAIRNAYIFKVTKSESFYIE